MTAAEKELQDIREKLTKIHQITWALYTQVSNALQRPSPPLESDDDGS